MAHTIQNLEKFGCISYFPREILYFATYTSKTTRVGIITQCPREKVFHVTPQFWRSLPKSGSISGLHLTELWNCIYLFRCLPGKRIPWCTQFFGRQLVACFRITTAPTDQHVSELKDHAQTVYVPWYRNVTVRHTWPKMRWKGYFECTVISSERSRKGTCPDPNTVNVHSCMNSCSDDHMCPLHHKCCGWRSNFGSYCIPVNETDSFDALENALGLPLYQRLDSRPPLKVRVWGGKVKNEVMNTVDEY